MSGWAELLRRPVLEAAPGLLGAVMRREAPEGTVAVRLTEVEAYDGERDPGSHAYRGPTRRNRVMFGPPGHVYVYFTYGMHHCMNIVCGAEGRASAVLLRAGEVVDGLELVRKRRGTSPDRDLARGPARLCSALDIDLSYNGLLLGTGPLDLELPPAPSVPPSVSTGPRVGLRHGAERPWRFWLTGERTVSSYRPAKKRAPGSAGRKGTLPVVPPDPRGREEDSGDSH